MGRANQPLWLARASDMVLWMVSDLPLFAFTGMDETRGEANRWAQAHIFCATLNRSGRYSPFSWRRHMENDRGQNQRDFWSRLRGQGRTTGAGIALGIAIGVAIGAAIGVAIGNLATGVAIGAGVGAAIGAALEGANQRQGRP